MSKFCIEEKCPIFAPPPLPFFCLSEWVQTGRDPPPPPPPPLNIHFRLNFYHFLPDPPPPHLLHVINVWSLKLPPEDISSNLQCVKLLLSDELISNIVKHTSNYVTMMQNLSEIRQCMNDSSQSFLVCGNR